ncbi:hypothetical protein BU26DRAFT_548443 [Trematosphaeria pertusa]|uniref:F-box domain-containing protein n=1 Tax=Trematosphaeria pertusa TaxID=390896 RepID=A0A6A6IMZ0_9PLEO|nr:uncharacterized protein BU26DRAFT_548443 [Trematosphaeria pertusa]KAF2251597.1 hypothetical protein BU26DRAFT_548443 [Trematosphaeria pertusa]
MSDNRKRAKSSNGQHGQTLKKHRLAVEVGDSAHPSKEHAPGDPEHSVAPAKDKERALAPGPVPKVSLISLPDELLLNTAKALSSQHCDTDLLTLAVVCRRFRGIVQEVALQPGGLLEPRNIWVLVQALLPNPSLAEAITQLRLTSLDVRSSRELEQSDDEKRIRITEEDYAICCDIIRKARPGENTKAWECAVMLEDSFASTGLSLILAMASNLTSLSIGASTIIYLPLLANLLRSGDEMMGVIHLKWHHQALSSLCERLEVLDIVDDSEYKKLMFAQGMHLRFHRFRKLKRLHLPMGSVVPRPRSNTPGPHITVCKALPRSLEYLRLYVGNLPPKYPFGWAERVIDNVEDCGDLRRVESGASNAVDFVVTGNGRFSKDT